MQRNRVIIWAVLGTALALSLGALFVRTPANWPPDNVEFHQQLIINIIMATLHTGGALLFMTNLDVYTAKLRRAYITLAIGTLVTGLGTLQLSVLTLISAWDTAYAQSGATMVPFLLSGVVLYFGVRSFALLVGVRHVFTRSWVALVGAFGLALASSLLPHAKDPRIPEMTYDLLVGISVWSGSLMLIAGTLSVDVGRHAGAHYSRAMTWLTRALIFSAFVLLYQAAYTLINLGYNPVLNAISNLITVLSGVMWVRAGYAFALTKYFERDVSLLLFLIGRTELRMSERPRTVIDMVTYAAALVSNSDEIDPLLDNVRSITAKLQPGENPSVTDTKRLVDVYLKIEQYLIGKEPIRSFSTHELRAQLSPELRELVVNAEK